MPILSEISTPTTFDAIINNIKHAFQILPLWQIFIVCYVAVAYLTITWRLVKYIRAKDKLGIKGSLQYYGIVTAVVVLFFLLPRYFFGS